ncbi:FitA-like ribbon-helix-helix domain-containing protein [Nocardia sp. NPDC003345]
MTTKAKAKTRKSVAKKVTAAASNLNVRNLDPAVKATIQRRATRHGRSMEAEVRDILARAVNEDDAPGAPNPLSGAALLARLAVLREALDGETPEFDTSFLEASEGR